MSWYASLSLVGVDIYSELRIFRGSRRRGRAARARYGCCEMLGLGGAFSLFILSNLFITITNAFLLRDLGV